MSSHALSMGRTRGVFVFAILMSCAAAAMGQQLSPERASSIFVEASSQVFAASARIFDCLHEARRGKSGSTGASEQALKAALAAYKGLADDRGRTDFRPGTEPGVQGVVAQVNALLASSPPPKWTAVRSLKTEGDVAQLNIDAINQLLNQIKVWKNCEKPSREVKEYIAFIQNKIYLEQTSQLAEIAFKK